MRFFYFLFTIWFSYLMLRLVVVPLFLYFMARHIRTKRAQKGAEFMHQESGPESYSECIVDAEFEDLN